MDGWVDGWMYGWVGGWMDGWMNGWMNGSMDPTLLFNYIDKFPFNTFKPSKFSKVVLIIL